MSSLFKTIHNFFVPYVNTGTYRQGRTDLKNTIALIPTWKPTPMAYDLVAYLLAWNPNMRVVIVDDNTPYDLDSMAVLNRIRELESRIPNLHLIHTPENRLKAGALNYGLEYIKSNNLDSDVIITFDDDVIIGKDTISELVQALNNHPELGAACTMVRVSNKNENLLTRLQALEYHGFNMMKMADNGFFSGPLVMQGMLTAFRTEALFAINGFTTGHLIEDYEITTRLKKEGWHVAIVPSSWAWTEVPNSLWTLWKQRVRWSYGGVQVLRSNWRFLPAILQDFIGHVMFVATSILIVLSFVIPRGEVDTQIVGIIILLAIAQSGFAYLTHLFLMRFYADRETYDWIIRATLVPELIYSYLMSLVLIGSYLFFAYNAIWRRIQARLPRTYAIQQLGLGLFARVGYSADWGTKETNSNQVISKEVSQIV